MSWGERDDVQRYISNMIKRILRYENMPEGYKRGVANKKPRVLIEYSKWTSYCLILKRTGQPQNNRYVRQV